MPSTQLMVLSGGTTLVSGDIFSGTMLPVGGIQLKLQKSAAGPVYVGLPWKNVPDLALFSGFLSGAVTVNSGGSLSSGGLADGFEMAPGDAYRIDRLRLTSGIRDIRIAVPAASSGSIMFWEIY